MSGLLENLYEMIINALVGKIKNYGCTLKFDRALPYSTTEYGLSSLTVEQEAQLSSAGFGVSCGQVSKRMTSSLQTLFDDIKHKTWYSDLKINEIDLSNSPVAKIMSENGDCALGLLSEAPIWYHGEDFKTINGSIKTNMYPALLFDGDTSGAQSCLKVMEIPNSPMPYVQSYPNTVDYFTNVNDPNYDPTASGNVNKLFHGGYWPSYSRFGIQKRLKDVSVSIPVSYDSVSKRQFSTFKVTGSGNVVDVLTEQKKWENNSSINDYERLLNLYNPAFMFIAENTDRLAWPAVKYFGFFKSLTNNRELKFVSGNPYLIDNQLYYWGELTENNKWYHTWTPSGSTAEEKAANWLIKKEADGLYELSGTTYVETTDSAYNSSKTYYEKNGIVVESTQGGLFSKNEFVISWDGNVITNDFTLS